MSEINKFIDLSQIIVHGKTSIINWDKYGDDTMSKRMKIILDRHTLKHNQSQNTFTEIIVN